MLSHQNQNPLEIMLLPITIPSCELSFFFLLKARVSIIQNPFHDPNMKVWINHHTWSTLDIKTPFCVQWRVTGGKQQKLWVCERGNKFVISGLTTTLHFHCQACGNGNTLEHHIHQMNHGPIPLTTKDESLLQELHWGPWILPSRDPAHGSQYPPYMAVWWHRAQ